MSGQALTLYFRRTGSRNMELLIPGGSELDLRAAVPERKAWSLEPLSGAWNRGQSRAVNSNGCFPAFEGSPEGKIYRTTTNEVPLNPKAEWPVPLEWPLNAAGMTRCKSEEVQQVFGGASPV